MKTHRQTLYEDSSSLRIGGFMMKQSKCLCDPGGQAPFPSREHKHSCCSEKYMANMDVTGKGGREPGGVWGLKEDQGRARNRCSSYTVLAFKALVGLFQDGLSVESDAHFHSGVLDLTLAQVVPRIPGLFPL